MEVTRNFDKIYKTKKRIVLNRWWTSSSKTYSILQLFFKWLLTWEFRENEYFTEWVWTVVRQYRSQIETSVLRDWRDIVDREWYILSNRHYWWKFIKENKSYITYKYQWRTLEFIWLDDPEKAKWPRRKILYCNEADSISKKVFMQLLMRTEWPALLDWNPDDEDVWIHIELEQERAVKIWDVDLIVSTFRDNCFLNKSIAKEILSFKDFDIDYWEVYGNGSYWKITWLVFNKINIVNEIPKDAKSIWYGMDFWYTNDPTTLTEIFIFNNELYFDVLLYKTWLTNQDIISELKRLWIWKSEEIFWDSAEPKSIEEIYRWWFNIKWVVKWPDSIIFWISIMKEYKLNITERSLEWRKEFKKYKWLVDKAWKALNKPIDNFNHCFTWDMRVNTPKGLVRIDKLSVWDYVNTPKWFQKILKVFNNWTKEIVEASFSNWIKLKCTKDHKIFVKWKWYKSIGSLLSLDIIDSINNKDAKIVDIKDIWKDNVYDLEIDNEHCYYVEWLHVHNCIDWIRYCCMMKLAKKKKKTVFFGCV